MNIRKRCLCLLLALLLLPAAAGLAAEETSPEIRVRLSRLHLDTRADMVLHGPYLLSWEGGEMLLPDKSEVSVQVKGEKIYLYVSGLSLLPGNSVTFRPLQPNQPEADGAESGLSFNLVDGLYPGELRLSLSEGALQPVLTLPLETYLLGVVPYEMSDSFPEEALKAQAVCARTYAMSRMKPKSAWDVTDTTNDQVFKGILASNTHSAAAVQATGGLVLTEKGRLITAWYSASNGGQTELPSHVWSGDAPACYAMVDDPYDLENPQSMVRSATMSRSGEDLYPAFLALIREAVWQEPEMGGFLHQEDAFLVTGLEAMELVSPRYKAPSRLMEQLKITVSVSARKILKELSSPTSSDSDDDELYLFSTPDPTPATQKTPTPTPEATPRISDFMPAGTFTVTLNLFPDVMNALGLSIAGAGNEILRLAEDDDSFTLTSGRYGHGVGLSQRGAEWMASEYGKTFEEILDFYYPGAKLQQQASALPPLPTPDPLMAEGPGPLPTATPRPTLKPVDVSALPPGARIASVEGIADDSSLNLRAAPSAGSEILMRLYKHQLLIVLGDAGIPGWVQVRTDAAEGYVMESFLEYMP